MSQQVIWVRRGGGPQEGTGAKSTRGADQPFGVRRVRVLKEVDSRMENLPPFPTVLTELVGLTKSDTSAADDLRRCIEKDAVLTARILKLANSAFYSPTVPVASVQQAVVMLGFLSVRSLAMAAATLKFLGADLHAYGIFPGGLWMHSYATAELAREFAREAKEDQDGQDAVYVGGLLHDIGKIVLGPILEGLIRDPSEEPRPEEAAAIVDWERRVADLNHCDVGGRLAEKWRLAPVTAASVRHHHAPGGADPSTIRAVRLVGLANLAAHRLGVGFREAAVNEAGETAMLEALGISGERYLEITGGYTEKVENVRDLFTGLK
ncbi:MAG: HDOD domain-containing protein [Candidatus Eisenbacteria bacterium]